MRRTALLLSLALAHLALAPASAPGEIVRIATDLGNIDVRLWAPLMPRTVTNFLNYTDGGDWNGSFIHRSAFSGSSPFVIQGGGYKFDNQSGVSQVPTDPPIADEPGGGVRGPSNVRGTIAMAKSGPNTVTSQWFVNLNNNSFLDDPTRSDGGFSAFGRLFSDGLAVADAISAVPRFNAGSPFNELPLRNYTSGSITSANLINVLSVTRLNLPAGDYDRNGVVDNADLAIWSSQFGRTDVADADGNGDGVVNAADYTVWRDTLGQHAPSAATGVPEPAAWIVSLCALCVVRRPARSAA